jgi:hypothetical protein
MNIENFIAELERLGFMDSGFRKDEDPFLRSDDVPENLQDTLVALNIGRAGKLHVISVQDKLHREIGGHFPMMNPTQELLDALAKGNEGFITWFSNRVSATTTETADGQVKQGVRLMDGRWVMDESEKVN